MDQATCLTEDCSEPPYSRGMCRNCYRRSWYKGFPGVAPLAPRHLVSEVDTQARTGVCVLCGPVKVKFKRNRNYYECETLTKRFRRPPSPQARRRAKLKHKYGLTVEQYDEMYAAADGACEICREALPLLHVDHDHDSGEVRGLLCSPCNKGLGHFKDNPSVLMSALEYLQGDEGARPTG